MDAIFSEGWSVGVAKQQEKVCNSITEILLCCQYFTLTINIVLYHVMHIQQTIDKKGKGKIDPTDEIEYPYFLPIPSFDLWVASTPIISNLVNLPNMSTSKDVQQQVDAIITGVVIETGIEKQGSPLSAPKSSLPMKRGLDPHGYYSPFMLLMQENKVTYLEEGTQDELGEDARGMNELEDDARGVDLQIPTGPITTARSKKLQEALQGLVGRVLEEETKSKTNSNELAYKSIPRSSILFKSNPVKAQLHWV
ncbi:Hypothetical predicted protein [Olea europaea subsp. europaea]|uniref:Uncharacterized protein n=1 Tax=Olea europaea subsp. europaea TaxID=158383 RepID=A0A8S0SGW5_OLEEU|nr:Hypothetical predicted protein [Olea europaea subsp. europaea]